MISPSEKLIWEGKPRLFAYVLGRALPIAMGTIVYLGSPLLGLLAHGTPAHAESWEIFLWVLGGLGLPGPFLFYLFDWGLTHYTLTDRALHVRRSFGHRTIIRSRILRVESDRETLDGMYPAHYGSLLLTVGQEGTSPLPIVQEVLLLSGIAHARKTQAVFQTGSGDWTAKPGDWCFGRTSTNLVRLDSRSR